MNYFTDNFDRFAIPGEWIHTQVGEVTVVARLVRDEDYHIDDDDCHNPDQTVTGCNDEQFERLLSARAAWFNDEWYYGGIVLEVSIGGIPLDKHAASLWGIEVNYPGEDNEYLTEVANNLLPEALSVATRKAAEVAIAHARHTLAVEEGRV